MGYQGIHRPMRVAHVITRMIIGGAQENTLFNCQDLVSEHGDEVLLICGPETGPEGDLLGRDKRTEQNTDPECFSVDGVHVKVIDSLRRNIHPVHDYQAAQQLRQTLRDFQPDVIHTHSAKGGLLGRYVGWGLKGPKVIHTVHGAPFHDYQSALARRFFVACERWAGRRCHHMISVADAMTDLMTNAGVASRDKFTTISSGMDVEPFVQAKQHRDRIRREFGLEDHHIVVGKIARLFHLKGHEDLITAARQVVNQHPNVRFLLVGDGILREPLQQQIASLNLTEHFVFSGLVPPSRVPEMIGAMDLLVHTSYREGLARALPQALISGIPAISYDIDGAREVVIDDETGYLVEAANINELAKRINDLVGDESKRNQYGKNGQAKFTDQFRHQTMTRKIRELYVKLLA